MLAPDGDDVRSLLILGVYGSHFALGLSAPFVLGLGYVWIDLYSPQNVAYSVVKAIPVSMVMGAATFTMYWLTDRRYPPRPTLLTVLLILFAGWVTLTTTWAVAPDLAWFKWNIAVKTLLFAVFMPFLFRSRIQLEALILTILFALSGNMISFGLKTVLTGGGYGRQLGLTHDLGGIAESSGVAMLGAAIIPLILFLKRHC
jgi:putative inorganic carbon (hco3(-)) transporter